MGCGIDGRSCVAVATGQRENYESVRADRSTAIRGGVCVTAYHGAGLFFILVRAMREGSLARDGRWARACTTRDGIGGRVLRVRGGMAPFLGQAGWFSQHVWVAGG